MVKKINEISMIPHTSLFPKLGKTGYRFNEALAEFVENSLDAREGTKVNVSIEVKKDFIRIIDDAKGMTINELENSLKLASSEKKEKHFGKFGLGLKTATTALGKYFEIKTSTAGEEYWHIFIYDEEKWLKEESWDKKEIIDFPKENSQLHGTDILIKKLNYSFYGNLVTNVKKQLPTRFNRQLQQNELSLKINSDTVSFMPVELINFNGKLKHEFILTTNKKEIISGWYGLTKKRNIGGNYGFDIFKDDRVIQKYIKLGFTQHPEIAQLVGEIHFDFVPTTHNKKEFIVESDEYKRAEETFLKFFKNESVLSKIRDLRKDLEPEKLQEKILTKLSSSFPEQKNRIKSKLKSTEVPVEINKTVSKHHIILNEKKYEYELLVQRFDNEFIMATSKVVESKILIYLNVDFPLYSLTRDKFFYLVFVIADELSKRLILDLKLNREYGELRDVLLLTLSSSEIQTRSAKYKD